MGGTNTTQFYSILFRLQLRCARGDKIYKQNDIGREFITSSVRMMPTEERRRGKKAQGLSQLMESGSMRMHLSLK
jgi:hypothetical protein